MIVKKIYNWAGNKSLFLEKLLPLFPPHETYIEPFFGSGVVFLNKPQARYNMLNDIDKNIYNFFDQYNHNFYNLMRRLENCPQYPDYIKSLPEEGVDGAVKFLKNTAIIGESFLKMDNSNSSKILLERLKTAKSLFSNVLIQNKDAISFLKSISLRSETDKRNPFVYCDPPYINTDTSTYKSFSEEDLRSLIETLLKMKVRFGITEDYKNRAIFEDYGLKMQVLGKRSTKTSIHKMKKDPVVETYYYNYELNNSLF